MGAIQKFCTICGSTFKNGKCECQRDQPEAVNLRKCDACGGYTSDPQHRAHCPEYIAAKMIGVVR